MPSGDAPRLRTSQADHVLRGIRVVESREIQSVFRHLLEFRQGLLRRGKQIFGLTERMPGRRLSSDGAKVAIRTRPRNGASPAPAPALSLCWRSAHRGLGTPATAANDPLQTSPVWQIKRRLPFLWNRFAAKSIAAARLREHRMTDGRFATLPRHRHVLCMIEILASRENDLPLQERVLDGLWRIWASHRAMRRGLLPTYPTVCSAGP
jgi:hypothetical protein